MIRNLYGSSMSDIVKNPPKNHLALLYEKYPGKIQFEKAGIRKDGKVIMEVKVDDGRFQGIGKNKSSAKLAAAKCVLRFMNKE